MDAALARYLVLPTAKLLVNTFDYVKYSAGATYMMLTCIRV